MPARSGGQEATAAGHRPRRGGFPGLFGAECVRAAAQGAANRVPGRLPVGAARGAAGVRADRPGPGVHVRIRPRLWLAALIQATSQFGRLWGTELVEDGNRLAPGAARLGGLTGLVQQVAALE